MPIKRPQLVNNEIYHVVTRGVGDSLIFKNDNDRYRAIFSLYEFNTTQGVEIRIQRRKRKNNGEQFSDRRKNLVAILTFCFMPNHIHLLLKQLKENGITQFMRKFGAGYAGYFNKKYNRKGHLFQGRFRAVHIKTDRQLQAAFVYIHINPISLLYPKWKERGIKDPQKAVKFIENYKWSSYQDYSNKNNFPSVTKRDFIFKIVGGESGCRKLVEDWINYKRKVPFNEVGLE